LVVDKVGVLADLDGQTGVVFVKEQFVLQSGFPGVLDDALWNAVCAYVELKPAALALLKMRCLTGGWRRGGVILAGRVRKEGGLARCWCVRKRRRRLNCCEC
jgi:hypothetical protein